MRRTKNVRVFLAVSGGTWEVRPTKKFEFCWLVAVIELRVTVLLRYAELYDGDKPDNGGPALFKEENY